MIEVNKIHLMDCAEGLKLIDDNSIDAVVTDPPYEIGFMGKSWDKTGIAYNVSMWKEVLRALKPGGHILSFGGARTYHRMACAIEDAGFEIRDQIMWVFGQGFPKSLSVGKSIDKMKGAEREVIGGNPLTSPATMEAKQWEGWGTCLKPSHEPISLARKP
jgi:site-specific DNA-methyltransferase (adenine-specific)